VALRLHSFSSMASSSTPRRSAPRWIILVAQGQGDLYEHLARAFQHDKRVEVVMDRRNDRRRDPPRVIDDLRMRGVAVIRMEL